jgi:hypothetical protein
LPQSPTSELRTSSTFYINIKTTPPPRNVDNYQTTRCHIPDDRNLRTVCDVIGSQSGVAESVSIVGYCVLSAGKYLPAAHRGVIVDLSSGSSDR